MLTWGNGAPGEALGGSIPLRESAVFGTRFSNFSPSRGGSNCPHPIVFAETGGFLNRFFSKMEGTFGRPKAAFFGAFGGGLGAEGGRQIALFQSRCHTLCGDRVTALTRTPFFSPRGGGGQGSGPNHWNPRNSMEIQDPLLPLVKKQPPPDIPAFRRKSSRIRSATPLLCYLAHFRQGHNTAPRGAVL